ncbi:LysR family transcriptional regulator [uncultured Alsobacter sp.]|uniref:LysR family transcriptional regulator n=1 Tax=uncultured Alsobacter sp. TaxID=1748258 RepID=UPI0025CDD726|nr:LysR family transcriptional regulator [uncultured Alsobacter sp.]
MAEINDWTLLRSFLAVWRRGSLSAAARATGLTQPTLGRHIDELEQGLGLALFTRSPGGLVPTEAARGLVTHAEAMEAAFAALVRAASAGGDAAGPRGTVRITASEIVGTFVLPDVLAPLRHRHPGIVLELALSNRTDDLLRRDADIAVRMARPKQDSLVARWIGTVPLGLYAHRDYVQRFGLPGTVAALREHHVVGFDRDDHSARAVVAGTLPIDRTLFSVRVDNDVAQVMAVRAGLGIGMIQKALARQDPMLVPVLAEEVAVALDCWLAMHEDQRNAPPVRAVFDALADGLSEWVAGHAA